MFLCLPLYRCAFVTILIKRRVSQSVSPSSYGQWRHQSCSWQGLLPNVLSCAAYRPGRRSV